MKCFFLYVTLYFHVVQTRSIANFAQDEAPLYRDRQCGSDLSNLWLDVVLVVDDSKAVTQTRMKMVKSLILNIFANGTKIGTRGDDPRTTRIGLVTYNWDASIIADLNQLQSFSDFNATISSIAISSTRESLLQTGLEAARSVIQKSENAGERETYKKVIIIFTSLYEEILLTMPLIDRLKAQGITIISVDGSVVDLGGHHFSLTDENVTIKIQNVLLQANCFCPNLWTQLRSNLSDLHSFKYGTCMLLNTLPAVWRAARLSCRNQFRNGHLLNEYDINKHNYVLEMFKTSTLTREPYTYHIGLSLVNGAWLWDQPTDMKLVNWTNWSSGYPLISSTASVGLNRWDGEGATWQNTSPMGDAEYYACEVDACDTDNYCETDHI